MNKEEPKNKSELHDYCGDKSKKKDFADEWKTIKGTHVEVGKDGQITKGPAALKKDPKSKEPRHMPIHSTMDKKEGARAEAMKSEKKDKTTEKTDKSEKVDKDIENPVLDILRDVGISIAVGGVSAALIGSGIGATVAAFAMLRTLKPFKKSEDKDYQENNSKIDIKELTSMKLTGKEMIAFVKKNKDRIEISEQEMKNYLKKHKTEIERAFKKGEK